MNISSFILSLLQEYREKNKKLVRVRDIVKEVVRTFNCHITTVYNAIAQLEMQDKIKVIKRNKEKYIVLNDERHIQDIS